jgi:hypothetical protein
MGQDEDDRAVEVGVDQVGLGHQQFALKVHRQISHWSHYSSGTF